MTLHLRWFFGWNLVLPDRWSIVSRLVHFSPLLFLSQHVPALLPDWCLTLVFDLDWAVGSWVRWPRLHLGSQSLRRSCWCGPRDGPWVWRHCKWIRNLGSQCGWQLQSPLGEFRVYLEWSHWYRLKKGRWFLGHRRQCRLEIKRARCSRRSDWFWLRNSPCSQRRREWRAYREWECKY